MGDLNSTGIGISSTIMIPGRYYVYVCLLDMRITVFGFFFGFFFSSHNKQQAVNNNNTFFTFLGCDTQQEMIQCDVSLLLCWIL